MNEDVLRDVIQRAEKIRHQCVGTAANVECLMYIKSNNELMMMHSGRTIFRTIIPDFYEVHPEIAYSHITMNYDEKKEPILDDLAYLDLFNLQRLAYCQAKYLEYIDTMDHHCLIVAQEEDLKENDSFQQLYQMRAGDGLGKFQVWDISHQYTIDLPYFVGLYGIKKADKYGVVVYDFDSLHFLVRITDKKPKLNPIDIIIKILKLP